MKSARRLSAKRNKVGVFVFALLTFMLTNNAQALTISTDWWSNQTDSLNVYDPWDSERVRLGDFTSGFIEGTVHFPEWGEWQITFNAHTDETWDLPSEYIEIMIDGANVNKLFNTPVNTDFQFDYLITGDHFGYRFNFSSPEDGAGQHMIMDPGSAEFLGVPVPEPTPLALMGLGLAGIGYWRKKAA